MTMITHMMILKVIRAMTMMVMMLIMVMMVLMVMVLMVVTRCDDADGGEEKGTVLITRHEAHLVFTFVKATSTSCGLSLGCPELLRNRLGGPLGPSWANLEPSRGLRGRPGRRLEAIAGLSGVVHGSSLKGFRASLTLPWICPGLSRGTLGLL
eukprot:4392986-Pyramimonas_sp.AAC.1